MIIASLTFRPFGREYRYIGVRQVCFRNYGAPSPRTEEGRWFLIGMLRRLPARTILLSLSYLLLISGSP